MTIVSMFLDLPPEVVLRIYSYLDLPELACMAQVSPLYAALASDPALHRNRLKIVAPSRIRHSLFGHSPQGLALRPTFGELVHRNVARGLMIESRWRRGEYLYTQGSVKQYEVRTALERLRTTRAVARLLRLRERDRSMSVHPLQAAGILPEEYTMTVSRSLLPTLRQLKWSFRKDKLAQGLRKGSGASLITGPVWLDRSKSIVREHERVRLALCPGIARIVRYYDGLALN